MAHYTLTLPFMAPVPVDRQIKLDFYEFNKGIFTEDWELSADSPGPYRR